MISHKEKRNQFWKESAIGILWAVNDTLALNERLFMRATSGKVGIGQRTVIERLSIHRKKGVYRRGLRV